MDILLPEYKRMLQVLVKHRVDFLLVGGYAVVYHGYDRVTTDMDLWLSNKSDNLEKFENALLEFGINPHSIDELRKRRMEDLLVFHYGERPQRIDFLLKVQHVNFDEAYAQAAYLPLGEIKVPVINYHHLILSKISNDRAQDKADVQMLQDIRKAKENRK
jgi:hypothetical protein